MIFQPILELLLGKLHQIKETHIFDVKLTALE